MFFFTVIMVAAQHKVLTCETTPICCSLSISLFNVSMAVKGKGFTLVQRLNSSVNKSSKYCIVFFFKLSIFTFEYLMASQIELIGSSHKLNKCQQSESNKFNCFPFFTNATALTFVSVQKLAIQFTYYF